MKGLLLICAVTLAASASQALTLKEKKRLAEWNETLKTDRSATLAKKNCGYEIPVKIDEKIVAAYMEANTGADSDCSSPRLVVAQMCEDATAKSELTKKVKSVECKLGTEKKAEAKLNGTTLTLTVAPGAANVEDKVKEYLENNL